MSNEIFELKELADCILAHCFRTERAAAIQFLVHLIESNSLSKQEIDEVLEAFFPKDPKYSKTYLPIHLANQVNTLSEQDQQEFAARYQPPSRGPFKRMKPDGWGSCEVEEDIKQE